MRVFRAYVNVHSPLDAPVLVVKYEDLKSDSLTQVKRMLEFLRVPYSEEELQKRLSQDYGKFHRNKTYSSSSFDPYTPEQRKYILTMIQDVVDLLKTHNNGSTFGIEEYLQH